MKKFIILLVLVLSFVFAASAFGIQVKWRSGRTGGGSTNLDGITGYSNGMPAFVWEDGIIYFYRYDTAVVAEEKDPFYICPDDAGCTAGSWELLRAVKSIKVDKTSTTVDCDDQGKLFTNDDAGATRTYSISCECNPRTEGFMVSFLVIEGEAIRVDPHANDSIFDESNGVAGNYIQSDTTLGTAVTVICVEEDMNGSESDEYNLITFGQVGAWTTQ